MPEVFDLTGKTLIAMPGMPEPRFANSVIVLCAHSADGAMGLMVNKPSEHVAMADLFDQLSIEKSPHTAHMVVHSGGPVEIERGFVLHSADYSSALSTLTVSEDLAMTATLDILEDIARGHGPRQSILALGYCGWGPGQLEAEIAQNGWLVGDTHATLVFDAADPRKWDLAMSAQGIDPLTLSSTFGRA